MKCNAKKGKGKMTTRLMLDAKEASSIEINEIFRIDIRVFTASFVEFLAPLP